MVVNLVFLSASNYQVGNWNVDIQQFNTTNGIFS